VIAVIRAVEGMRGDCGAGVASGNARAACVIPSLAVITLHPLRESATWIKQSR
jgi:hypothetical protein